MILPSKIAKIKKMEARYCSYYWMKEDGEDLYIWNNIIFRVAKIQLTSDVNGNVYINDYA